MLMIDGSFIAQYVGLIFLATTSIGIIMAIKWKNRNFVGSPSHGIGWIKRKLKTSKK